MKMHCACKEPELEEGYSIGSVGTLSSVAYCSDCGKPWEDNGRSQLMYAGVLQEPRFSYIMDSNEWKVTVGGIETGVAYRWEKELSLSQIEEGIEDVVAKNKVVARRQWTGVRDSSGRRVYTGDILGVRGYRGVLMRYHIGGLTAYSTLLEWSEIATVIGNEYMHPALMNKVLRSVGGA